jgi:hypothetical protein
MAWRDNTLRKTLDGPLPRKCTIPAQSLAAAGSSGCDGHHKKCDCHRGDGKPKPLRMPPIGIARDGTSPGVYSLTRRCRALASVYKMRSERKEPDDVSITRAVEANDAFIDALAPDLSGRASAYSGSIAAWLARLGGRCVRHDALILLSYLPHAGLH